MNDKRPVIGLVVSTHIEETGDIVVNPKIKQLIEDFGGEVLPIDYRTIEGDALADAVKGCDGVLLPGGGDMDPGYYDEDKLPECGEPNAQRDIVESAIMLLAANRDLPVFGICRGCQVINVYFGGTLYQDLPSQKGVVHRQDDKNGRYCHNVDIAEDTLLRDSIGSSKLLVNSYHHQAVKDPAPDLRISAVSEADGIIEAFEGTGEQWVLGVQWHPESIPDDPASRSIFKAFMDAVNNNRR